MRVTYAALHEFLYSIISSSTLRVFSKGISQPDLEDAQVIIDFFQFLYRELTDKFDFRANVKQEFNLSPYIDAIKRMFALRWRLIQGTPFDYFHAPFSFANRYCLQLAELICNNEEAVCQLLMPTITHSVTQKPGESLKASTEKAGSFTPEFCMLTERGQLLHILDFLKMLKNSPKTLSKVRDLLSPQDIHALMKIDDAVRIYLDTIVTLLDQKALVFNHADFPLWNENENAIFENRCDVVRQALKTRYLSPRYVHDDERMKKYRVVMSICNPFYFGKRKKLVIDSRHNLATFLQYNFFELLPILIPNITKDEVKKYINETLLDAKSMIEDVEIFSLLMMTANKCYEDAMLSLYENDLITFLENSSSKNKKPNKNLINFLEPFSEKSRQKIINRLIENDELQYFIAAIEPADLAMFSSDHQVLILRYFQSKNLTKMIDNALTLSYMLDNTPDEGQAILLSAFDCAKLVEWQEIYWIADKIRSEKDMLNFIDMLNLRLSLEGENPLLGRELYFFDVIVKISEKLSQGNQCLFICKMRNVILEEIVSLINSRRSLDTIGTVCEDKRFILNDFLLRLLPTLMNNADAFCKTFPPVLNPEKIFQYLCVFQLTKLTSYIQTPEFFHLIFHNLVKRDYIEHFAILLGLVDERFITFLPSALEDLHVKLGSKEIIKAIEHIRTLLTKTCNGLKRESSAAIRIAHLFLIYADATLTAKGFSARFIGGHSHPDPLVSLAQEINQQLRANPTWRFSECLAYIEDSVRDQDLSLTFRGLMYILSQEAQVMLFLNSNDRMQKRCLVS